MGSPPVSRGGLGGTGPPRLTEPLTDSETRILRYLPTHLTAQEIGRELSLSVHTVTTHMRHLYAKLGVHRRRQAVERARALGLLAPTPATLNAHRLTGDHKKYVMPAHKVRHQARECIPGRSRALPGPRPRAAEQDAAGRLPRAARSGPGIPDPARRPAARGPPYGG